MIRNDESIGTLGMTKVHMAAGLVMYIPAEVLDAANELLWSQNSPYLPNAGGNPV